MHGILNGTGNKLLGWDEFGAKDAKHYGENPTGGPRKRKRRSKIAVLAKLKGVKPARKRKKKHRGNPY